MKLENKKIVTVLIVLICILQVAMSLFWTKQKDYLFMDEMFSYASANNAEKVGTVFPANEWLDESWYLKYMSVQSEHRFDYKIPYYNQDADVHPPLFYMFLHTACSLIPGNISYTAGIFWNIVFFVGSTIVLYFLSKAVFHSKSCGILIAFLYAISFAGMNTVVFIRMYMLLTFLTLLHILIYVHYFQKEDIPTRAYVLLGISLVMGVLTQYYFLFVAFFAAVWYGIKYMKDRQYIKLAKYLGIFVLSGITCIVLYPTMLRHLLGTGRSKEAMENFASAKGYVSNLRTMWNLLDSQLFTNLFWVILIGIVAVRIYSVVKKKTINYKINSSIGMILVVCLGYFLIVTKVAPYQIDRYLMPIYPLVYMITVGIAYIFLGEVIKEKYAFTICVLGFAGLSIIHMLHSGIPYTYAKDQCVTNRVAVANEHCQSYAVYIGPKDDMSSYYDVLQILKKYQGYYNINDLSLVSEVKADMEYLKQENEVILYIEHQENMEAVYSFVNDIFSVEKFGENNMIHCDQKWNVYLMTR